MTSILIIEDEPQIRLSLERFLKLHDFQVLSAEDGKQGVEMAKSHLPDMILCDIMMPELNGYDVKQKLATDIQTDSIPFIFLTAKASLSDLRQGMNLGADDYLTKPFKFEDVLTAIEARLKRQNSLSRPYQQELEKLEGFLQPEAEPDVISSSSNHPDIQRKFQMQMQELKSAQQAVIPLLLFEMGRYLEISSSYGHATAQCLLNKVVARFNQYFKNQGAEIITGRLGSHHLALLLPSTSQADSITDIVQGLLGTLRETFSCNQQSINLQGYFGISLAIQDGEEWNVLLNNAEIALQYALQKEQQYRYYSPSLQSQLSRRYQIENLLRSAVKQQEFEVYFQPKVSIERHQVIGAEALIRWPNSALGSISPVEFIPIAEARARSMKLVLGCYTLRANKPKLGD